MQTYDRETHSTRSAATELVGREPPNDGETVWIDDVYLFDLLFAISDVFHDDGYDESSRAVEAVIDAFLRETGRTPQVRYGGRAIEITDWNIPLEQRPTRAPKPQHVVTSEEYIEPARQLKTKRLRNSPTKVSTGEVRNIFCVDETTKSRKQKRHRSRTRFHVQRPEAT